jgi:propanol-preferring alcohol dehydrogenase
MTALLPKAVDRRELLKLDFAVHLWQEKQIQSVANLTRRDVREFLAPAA